MINIRIAHHKDIGHINAIYERIHTEEENGSTTIGWLRDIYPTRKTAEDALSRNDLFVMEDEGKIVAAAIINKLQVPEYRSASWKYAADDDEVMVLHTLVVDPLVKHKGYGKSFVLFYEDYAKQHNCKELRMDTNQKNERARKMYHGLGYEEIGTVLCNFNGIPNVPLVCLEKHLT